MMNLNTAVLAIAFGVVMPAAALWASHQQAAGASHLASRWVVACPTPATVMHAPSDHAAVGDNATILQVDVRSRFVEVLADGYRQPVWYPVAHHAVIRLRESSASLDELRPGDRVAITVDRTGEQPLVVQIIEAGRG